MPKQELSRKRVLSEDLESDEESFRSAAKHKKSKTVTSSQGGMNKDDEGNEYWEISNARRVQISEFKGKTMVSIREYYEKDGKMNPGKKGISLPVEQFNAMLEHLPEIEAVLKSKGVDVKRPTYDGAAADASANDEGDSESEDKKPRRKKTSNKPNHEATSDEDED